MTTSSEWTWRRALEQAYERLSERGIQRMPRPSHEYKDLGEVEEVERLGDVALANMMVRTQSWYSYATSELAYAKAAQAGFDEIYEVVLGTQMNRVSKTSDSRIVKDVLKSLAIDGDENLKSHHRSRVEHLQMVMLLEGTVKSLEIRCRALEGEQIRRASQRKVEVHR